MRRFQACAFALAATSLLTPACAGGSRSTLGPSPLIVPDAASLTVGAAAIFVVQNATVARFEAKADGQDWAGCVELDSSYVPANSVRVIARHRCRGPVYLAAILGGDRSPLVAVIETR